MAKYTITIEEMIQNNVKIFDFDYPFYSEPYRKTFEENFINYFMFDEIGCETISRFKHNLKTKFNLIMPYWNKILIADSLEQRILDNYDVTEKFEKINTTVKNDNINSNTNSSIINNVENKNLFTETPGKRVDINNIDYVTNITKDISNNTNNANGTSSATNLSNVNDNEQWTRTMQGNIGVQTDSDAIVHYWDSLRQIEIEIFNQCSNLFMEVF